MFNRARFQASDFYTCFAAGILIGINTTRNQDNFKVEMLNLVLPFFALYAGLRFPGDFDQRTNRSVGLVLGVFVGAYAAHNLRAVMTPPAASLRP